MGRIIVVVGVVLAVLVGAVVALPNFIPQDVYRKTIEEQASKALGRKVTVTGNISVGIFPRIEAKAGTTTIANPDGFGAAPFASMKELRAAVKLIPLIFQKVEIDEFVLVDPTIGLVQLENGGNNWTFDIPGAAPKPNQPQKPSQIGASLGNVHIINGQVSFEDRKAKTTHALSALDLTAQMQAIDQPFSIHASGQADSLPFTIDTKIANPKAMIDGKATPLEANLKTDVFDTNVKGSAVMGDKTSVDLTFDATVPSLPKLADAFKLTDLPARTALGKVTLSGKAQGSPDDLTVADLTFKHEGGLAVDFTGQAHMAKDLTFKGHVSAVVADLRKLAEGAGTKLPPGDIYKRFAFAGDAAGGPNKISLTNAAIDFDAIHATGQADIGLAGKPKITGQLATNVIDATPYAAASGAPEEQKKSNGWGNDPIDLSPLKAADADLTLKAEGVKFQKFDFGPSNLLITLAGGKLTADLKQTSLFGGSGSVVAVADGSGPVAAVGLKANVDKLALKPLLSAAAGFDMVEGAGGLNVDISGSGANLQALMSSLAGNGKFDFDNGLIKGVNLTELGNAAKTALSSKSISLNAFSKDAQTKFSGLKASFNMKDGVAAMSDLKLDAEGIAVAGGGALDIGKQKLSLSLFPQFNSKSQGLNGYGLPVKLAGGWDGVGLSLDWDWLAQKAVGDVKGKVANSIQDELKKQLGGSAFSGLLGQGATAAAAQPAASQSAGQAAPSQQPAETPKSDKDKLKDAAKNQLNKLLGKGN
ncbi:MAG TPA: AsmA family protein [Hyphomonadaceae bacterium]|nr:AsmA family protein [Hyphomonadaceae bacterium]